jgi:hypothetical protein
MTIAKRPADWQAAMRGVFDELYRRVVRSGGFVAFEVGEVRGGKLRLEDLLFEGRFTRTVGRLDAFLLRIVREASSAVLPGATRGILCEEFRTAILREAKRTGEAESDVRTRIDRDPVELAKIVSAAVDALALSRPPDREELLRRIEALESARQGTPEPSK